MITDIEQDYFSEIFAKIHKNTQLGLLTETYEVRLRLIKTPNIHIFKMAAPTEDLLPYILRTWHIFDTTLSGVS